MRARRLPTGGLATLAALLAALAVVLVAGQPAARTVVDTVFASTTTSTTTSPTNTVTTTTAVTTSSGARRAAPPRATAPRGTSTERRASSTTRRPATRGGARPTSGRPVTTPSPPVTTTTRPSGVGPAVAVTRTGTLLAGVTSWTARVGPVAVVSVSVRPGRRVTLTVVCGLAERSATSLATATVAHLRGEGSCQATFSIPTGGTGSVAWRVVTT